MVRLTDGHNAVGSSTGYSLQQLIAPVLTYGR